MSLLLCFAFLFLIIHDHALTYFQTMHLHGDSLTLSYSRRLLSIQGAYWYPDIRRQGNKQLIGKRKETAVFSFQFPCFLVSVVFDLYVR